jgi:hypothetical protein
MIDDFPRLRNEHISPIVGCMKVVGHLHVRGFKHRDHPCPIRNELTQQVGQEKPAFFTNSREGQPISSVTRILSQISNATGLVRDYGFALPLFEIERMYLQAIRAER